MSARDRNAGHIKVAITVRGGGKEVVWAKKMGGGKAKIANTPFFTSKVHNGDVVTTKRGKDGLAELGKVVKPSGNRTALVRFDADSSHKQRVAIGKVLKRHKAVAWEWGGASLLGTTLRPGTNTRRLEDDLDRVLPVDGEMAVNGESHWGWAAAGAVAAVIAIFAMAQGKIIK